MIEARLFKLKAGSLRGQPNQDLEPSFGTILQRNLATVSPDNVARNGHAKTHSARFPVARRLDTLEWAEGEFNLVRRNSWPVIGVSAPFSSVSVTLARLPYLMALPMRLSKALFIATGWQKR